jgi:1-acyl-sn-glycerol-3-phosphate acyltransferase
MRAAGFVEVDRQNRHRAIASLRRASEALKGGTSIWIAPEGTRSESGRLGSFKQGGFHLAVETGARILPVSIEGSRNVLLARGWTVHTDQRVKVTISPPVDPKDFGNTRRKELTDVVRRAIAAHISQEREARPARSEPPELAQTG